MTRIRTAVLVVVPLLVGACSEEAPTAPGALPLTHRESGRGKDHARAVSIDGRCNTDVTLLPPNAGDLPNRQRYAITYVCQLKHLGRTTAIAAEIIDVTGGDPVNGLTAVGSNTTTYTAANGDKLFATWTGTATIMPLAGTIVFAGPEIYAGGTGRFVGASGSSWISGAGAFTGPTTAVAQFTLVGTLRYARHGDDDEWDDDAEPSDHPKR